MACIISNKDDAVAAADAALALPSESAVQQAANMASTSAKEKKRSADTQMAAPPMTKAAASKAISSVKVPKKPKVQSQYVRFKALLLKDAKANGDTDTSSNITKVAKEAWNKVKNITPPPPVDPATKTISSSSASSSISNYAIDTQSYLLIKGRAIKAEADEKKTYKTEVKAFCASFATAAESHVKWATIEATEDNFSALKSAVNTVATKYNAVTYDWDHTVDASALLSALKEAKEQLAAFEDIQAERDLLSMLRDATDHDLVQHAKIHRQALRRIAELESIKAKYDLIQAKQSADKELLRMKEEKEISSAYKIKNEIISNFKKQMKYSASDWNLSYRRGGVSQKVFAAAFSVPIGTKKATISGSSVGRKDLRYGAWLECKNIDVKLVGEELTAKSYYTMEKMGRR